MNDETRKNLVDVLQAGEEIQDFVSGMDFKAYQSSPVKLLTGLKILMMNYLVRFQSITAS
jgi:uncharacterized protein with HEPN domain